MSDGLSDMRHDYDTPGLGPEDLGDDPLAAVRGWLDAAIAEDVPQANAMSVATAGADGRPSVRTVLLKEIDHGLVFYTNYDSRKGAQIAENSAVAISVTWVTMHRQIRAEGHAERVSAAISDAYFVERPYGAQIAAVASRQSEELVDRTRLEARFADAEREYPEDVPRPEHWGGYRVVPDRIEFWQGRRNRMHDRIEFMLGDGGWIVRRLSP